MNISDTLSVDPGRTTLGALNPEFSADFLRAKRIADSNKRSALAVLNFIFATNGLKSNVSAGAMAFLRCALGAALIVSGAFILSGEIVSPSNIISPEIYAYLEIAVGTLLAVGLLTRFAMGAATIGFGIIATMNVINGVFDMQAMMTCLCCMVFTIFGAGRFSSDFLVKKVFLNHSVNKRRKMIENKMSYRAFRYAAKI